jgi:hypothetical protein
MRGIAFCPGSQHLFRILIEFLLAALTTKEVGFPLVLASTGSARMNGHATDRIDRGDLNRVHICVFDRVAEVV